MAEHLPKIVGGIDNHEIVETKVDVLSFPSKHHPNHAGIVVDIAKERVTALTPVSPEIMIIQKELALQCSEIVRF